MYVTGWTVALAALGAIPAYVLDSRAVAWLWVIGTIAIAGLDALLAPATRSVAVKREAPRAIRLTESTTARISVANLERRRVSGTVRDAWVPSAGATHNRHDFRLGGLETVRFETPLHPTRRGDRAADLVTLRLRGPLRLGGRQRSFEVPSSLRVLPEFRARRHLPSRLARLREIDGQTSVNLRGAGSEFDSLREYVIGDDVRTIDWRASARRADVVVRTFRPERDRRVFVVVESARLSAGRVGDGTRLDASMEAALLLAALATHAGDRVQVVAWDREERARAMGSTGPQVMPKLADAFAGVEPELLEPDWAGVTRLVNERLNQRSLVVLLTTLDRTAIDSGLLRTVATLSHDHQVIVATATDPEIQQLADSHDSIEALYGAAAAERGMLETSALASRLAQFGAEVVMAPPDEVAPVVSDTYLALKAAGRL